MAVNLNYVGGKISEGLQFENKKLVRFPHLSK
jgi:hypothetical protein